MTSPQNFSSTEKCCGTGCHTPPGINTFPTLEHWNTKSLKVVSEQDQWAARASAAENAVQTIAGAVKGLRDVLKGNYFGTDCAEGAAIHSALSSMLSEWTTAMNRQAATLSTLANTCRTAGDTLNEIDSENGNDIKSK